MQETIRYKKLLTAIENTRTLITWEIQIILFTRKWKITIKYSYLTPKKFSNTVFLQIHGWLSYFNIFSINSYSDMFFIQYGRMSP